MNKVTLNGQKIVDSITEGYPVTVIREDGFRYIISMERKRGEEVYSYQFGRIKREFDSFDNICGRAARANRRFLNSNRPFCRCNSCCTPLCRRRH